MPFRIYKKSEKVEQEAFSEFTDIDFQEKGNKVQDSINDSVYGLESDRTSHSARKGHPKKKTKKKPHFYPPPPLQDCATPPIQDSALYNNELYFK